MFGYETNQKQIDRHRDIIKDMRRELDGIRSDYYGHPWLTSLPEGTRTKVDNQSATINNLKSRLSILEEIVREAGLFTDLEPKDVKIREDRSFSLFGDVQKQNIAYKINKVVTKK
jgi:hypothetical protein